MAEHGFSPPAQKTRGVPVDECERLTRFCFGDVRTHVKKPEDAVKRVVPRARAYVYKIKFIANYIFIA